MTLGRGSEPRRRLQGRRGENEESRQVIGCPSGLGWGYLELNEWREQQNGGGEGTAVRVGDVGLLPHPSEP